MHLARPNSARPNACLLQGTHTTMETFNPTELKRKPNGELWQMRKQVTAELDSLGNGDLSADDKAREDRAIANLKAIDSALEEGFRVQATQRYNGVGHELAARDKAAVDWLRSAMLEKNPASFTIQPEEQRSIRVWEQRDTLKSTATQAMNVSVYNQFVLHMVEQTPVIRAGATVVETATGEDLQVPKSTAFQSAALIAEGASITESDPTLAVTTLKSYKYAAFWQLSRELADDTPTNLIDALAQGCGYCACACLWAASGDGYRFGPAPRLH